MRRLHLVLGALLVVSVVSHGQAPRVVATTAWVAAFIRSAGFAGPIRVLAPAELQHPPEYELRPSDIQAVAGAELLVFAGYERMVGRLRDAVGTSGAKMLQIVTDHSMKSIQASVRLLAGALGTGVRAEENLRAIDAFMAEWRRELEGAGLAGASVLAHAMQKPLLAELGFTIAGVFGPGPLEAAGIRALSRLGAVLIVDNAHNPVGAPLKETVRDARYLALVNFPAADVSVVEILAENRRRLAAAWEGRGR